MLVTYIRIEQSHDVALHDKYRNNKIVIQVHSQSLHQEI